MKNIIKITRVSILISIVLLIDFACQKEKPIEIIKETTYIKTYGGSKGDYGYSIVLNNDSSVYIYGNTYSFTSTGNPAYLIKCNYYGDTILTKEFPYSNLNKHGYKILSNDDKSLIISGYIDGGIGIYIHKIDLNGLIIWSKEFKEGSNSSFSSIIKTPDGSFLIEGHAWGPPSYAFTIKLNANGESLWLKKYNSFSFASINNTSDGNYISAGKLTIADGVSGRYGLIKITPLGDTIWTKSYFVEQNTRVSYSFESTDANIILAGGYYMPSQQSTGFIVKTNQLGVTLWSKTYHSGEIDDYIIKVVENNDLTYTFISNIVTNAGSSTYIRLTKIDSDGNIIWNKDFNSFGCSASDVIKTFDGGYFIVGYYRNNPLSNNSDDVLLIKTDMNGNL